MSVLLLPRREGPTRFGRADVSPAQDIILSGTDIAPEHCIVELHTETDALSGATTEVRHGL